MAGLDRPTAGEVLVDGQPIQNLSEDQLAVLRRHKVGFVFQSFQLLTNLTARENVLLPVELLGQPDTVGRHQELQPPRDVTCRGRAVCSVSRLRRARPTSCAPPWVWENAATTTRASSPAAS